MIETLYKTNKTVFTFNEVSMLLGETDAMSLKSKINYHVKNKKLKNPRRGIYSLPEYSKEELACKLYTPNYISLEYVLQKQGVIFQYQEEISIVSYLSRRVTMDLNNYSYKKIKKDILLNTKGVILGNDVNVATKERAILDLLYLKKEYYFDNLNGLNKDLIRELLATVYCNKTLSKRAKKVLDV
jgi:hypothetical protein